MAFETARGGGGAGFPVLPGFRVVERIDSDEVGAWFRGRSEEAGEPVVIRTLTPAAGQAAATIGPCPSAEVLEPIAVQPLPAQPTREFGPGPMGEDPAGGRVAIVYRSDPVTPLADVLAHAGRLSPGQVVSLVQGVAVALAPDGRIGVHGRIGLVTILLDRDGQVRLGDHGVAAFLGHRPTARDDAAALARAAIIALTGLGPGEAERQPSPVPGLVADLVRLATQPPEECTVLEVAERVTAEAVAVAIPVPAELVADAEPDVAARLRALAGVETGEAEPDRRAVPRPTRRRGRSSPGSRARRGAGGGLAGRPRGRTERAGRLPAERAAPPRARGVRERHPLMRTAEPIRVAASALRERVAGLGRLAWVAIMALPVLVILSVGLMVRSGTAEPARTTQPLAHTPAPPPDPSTDPSSSEPERQTARPVLPAPQADPSGPATRALDLAQALADQRASAWSDLDESLLADLDAPSSPAASADRAALRAARRAGVRYEGYAVQVTRASAHDLPGRSGDGAVRLEVTMDTSSYAVQDARGRRVTRPARTGQRLALVLTWSGQRWQVHRVEAG